MHFSGISAAQKRLAELYMDWSAWESAFLNSIVAQIDERLADKRKEPLTIAQAEKLVELHDATIRHEPLAGFSVKAIVNHCVLNQDLLDDNEVEVMQHHQAAGSTKLRRREIPFLFVCARKAMAIEPYQGWHLPKLDLDAA